MGLWMVEWEFTKAQQKKGGDTVSLWKAIQEFMFIQMVAPIQLKVRCEIQFHC